MKHKLFKQLAASLAVAAALAAPAVAMEAPEGIVYCGGDPNQQIEFVIRPYTGQQWNASMTIDGQRVRAMSSYSYFGRKKAPEGFVVILMAETGDDYMVFEAGGVDLSRFSAAPGACLSHLPFESDRAFPAQC